MKEEAKPFLERSRGKAGIKAIDRSAHVEAIGHAGQGMS